MKLAAPGLARIGRAVLALAALLALVIAMALAAQHPVAPAAVLCGVWLVAIGTVWRPAGWLFWWPALMPVLGFFPWTGWWLVDESDLFVLAVLAGGYARWAWQAPAAVAPAAPRWLVWGGMGLALCVAQAVWRGWTDAPPLPPHSGVWDALRQGLYADHLSAWNSVRVAKGFVWLLLLAPLVWRALSEAPSSAGRALLRGMVTGLALVGALVLWERQTQLGLLDFVSGYRPSAAFWEMHVGGGAIDAYLALAAPLALWAVWTAPTAVRAWGAMGLLWLAVYTLLTTYSRGVMGAFVVVLLAWALVARLCPPPQGGRGPGQRRVLVATLVALLVQGTAVLGTGAFLGGRLEQSHHDLLGRWAHWQRGLSLVQTPVSAGAGLWGGAGMGRFTAQYQGLGLEGELPGRARWVASDAEAGGVLLTGPASWDGLATRFGLLQRVRPDRSEGFTVRLRLAGEPDDQVLVTLCQRHQIHALRCQRGLATVGQATGGAGSWQLVALEGPPLTRGDAAAAPVSPVVLALHPTAAGQTSRVHGVQLFDALGVQHLQNTDFAHDLRHWMPAALGYYQPWHTDNLYLDLLLELGLVGLIGLAAAGLAAFAAVWRGLQQRDVLAWGYGAAGLGFVAVGLLISVSEVPRVLLLAGLTLLMPLMLWTKR